VEWRGFFWCENGVANFDGEQVFKFRDRYDFAQRNWKPIVGDPGTDELFWLYQTYGDPEPFNISGTYSVKRTVSVGASFSVVSGPGVGGGSAGGTGPGTGGGGYPGSGGGGYVGF
jgi:hypothetical protein